jgi:Icc-related predicted phosphoesterase
MRIAYVVDVHDRFEAVGQAISETGPVDLLVVGGDITTFGSPDDAERAIDPAAARPEAARRGRELATRPRSTSGSSSSESRSTAAARSSVSSASPASRRPALAAPHAVRASRRRARRRGAAALADVAAAGADLLSARSAVRDGLRPAAFGEACRQPCARALVEQEGPDLVLCGHIHEARATDELGPVQVVNPGPVASGHYALVDVGEKVTVTLD